MVVDPTVVELADRVVVLVVERRTGPGRVTGTFCSTWLLGATDVWGSEA